MNGMDGLPGGGLRPLLGGAPCCWRTQREATLGCGRGLKR